MEIAADTKIEIRYKNKCNISFTLYIYASKYNKLMLDI